MEVILNYVQVLIEQIDIGNQKRYSADFKRKGETAEYIEMYLEEFPEEELAN